MQAQNLAGMDPGKAKKIYLHWTAGGYNSVVGPYHTIFTGDGTRHRRVDYNTRSGHTESRNTGAVGLSVAAMAGGHGNYQWPKEAQLDAMAAEAARLGKAWGWKASDINIKNIMTHGGIRVFYMAEIMQWNIKVNTIKIGRASCRERV